MKAAALVMDIRMISASIVVVGLTFRMDCVLILVESLLLLELLDVKVR